LGFGDAAHEALRVYRVCDGEHGGASLDTLLGAAVVHVGRPVEADAAVVVLVKHCNA
jgi:hypothetical protein